MIDFVSEVDYEKMISPIGKLYTTSIDTAFTFSPARELATLFYYTIFFFLEVFSLLPYISKKKMGRSSQMMYSTFPPGTSEMELLL